MYTCIKWVCSVYTHATPNYCAVCAPLCLCRTDDTLWIIPRARADDLSSGENKIESGDESRTKSGNARKDKTRRPYPAGYEILYRTANTTIIPILIIGKTNKRIVSHREIKNGNKASYRGGVSLHWNCSFSLPSNYVSFYSARHKFVKTRYITGEAPGEN